MTLTRLGEAPREDHPRLVAPVFCILSFALCTCSKYICAVLITHASVALPCTAVQWEAAEEAIHQIVTHSDDEFSLTYEDLKKMLDWKDRLEELSVKCKTLVSRREAERSTCLSS